MPLFCGWRGQSADDAVFWMSSAVYMHMSLDGVLADVDAHSKGKGVVVSYQPVA